MIRANPTQERLLLSGNRLQAAECVAIEDSIGGIRSAHEAGMRCLAVAHSYGRSRLRTANPQWVIDSIAEFKDWLEKEVSK
jgi:beta-phosphoglucomutase-like phosphatase (HAD superfamily)